MKNKKLSQFFQYCLSILLGVAFGGFLFKFMHWPVLIGAPLGGLISYIGCAWPEFVQGIKKSYNETIAWRPSQNLKWAAVIWAIVCIGFLECALIVYLNVWGRETLLQKYFLVSLASGVLSLFIAVGSALDGFKEIGDFKIIRLAILLLNPIIGPISLCAGILYCVVLLIYEIVKLGILIKDNWLHITIAIKNFFVVLLRTIHSRLRFVAGISTMIGICAGYFWGGDSQILFGMIVGLAVGILDYVVVGIKILKLKPAL